MPGRLPVQRYGRSCRSSSALVGISCFMRLDWLGRIYRASRLFRAVALALYYVMAQIPLPRHNQR